MNLHDLKQNIKGMNSEQLSNLLREVRQSRRTSKKPITAAKAIKAADAGKLLGAVDKLSAEERAALLADLLAEK